MYIVNSVRPDGWEYSKCFTARRYKFKKQKKERKVHLFSFSRCPGELGKLGGLCGSRVLETLVSLWYGKGKLSANGLPLASCFLAFFHGLTLRYLSGSGGCIQGSKEEAKMCVSNSLDLRERIHGWSFVKFNDSSLS